MVSLGGNDDAVADPSNVKRQRINVEDSARNSPALEDEKDLEIRALKSQAEQLQNEKQDLQNENQELEFKRETDQQKLAELESTREIDQKGWPSLNEKLTVSGTRTLS